MRGSPEGRSRYLALRREGRTRGEAAIEMDLAYSDSRVLRWERWFEAEGGAAEFQEADWISTRHRPPGVPTQAPPPPR